MVVDNYRPSHWRDAKEATKVENAGLFAALTNIVLPSPLKGGVLTSKMSQDIGDGVYRNVRSLDKLAVTLDPQVSNMAQCWDRAVQLYPNNECLGTREILNVRVEKKRFEKFTLSDSYTFINFRQANTLIHEFGAGLSVLGAVPKDKVNIYADTCAKWQMAMQACFREGLVVATTYANLGKSAVEYGINQVHAEFVITDAHLVHTIKEVLDKCPQVKYVVFFSDRRPVVSPHYQSDEATKALLPEGVTGLTFEEVCLKGRGLVERRNSGEQVPAYKEGDEFNKTKLRGNLHLPVLDPEGEFGIKSLYWYI